MTKKYVYGFLILVLLFTVLTGCSNNNNTDTNNSGLSIIYTGNYQLKHKVYDNSGTLYSEADSGYDYLLVEVEGTNNNKETIYLNPLTNFDAHLFDENENKYDPVMLLILDDSFSSYDIKPGQSKTGYIVFEVPKDITQANIFISYNNDTTKFSIEFGKAVSNKIIFSEKNDNNFGFDIYMLSPDGSSKSKLTNYDGLDRFPTWSPDGSQIAFTSYRDGEGDIFIKNVEGGGLVNLTDEDSGTSNECKEPSWSPNGNKIAFKAYDEAYNKRNIFTINVDGSNLTRITTQGGESPAWSPDGNKIAFSSDRDGTWKVYVINLNDNKITKVTKNFVCIND